MSHSKSASILVKYILEQRGDFTVSSYRLDPPMMNSLSISEMELREETASSIDENR